MRRLIELTKDIPNPEHDRRHKYGVEAIPVFKQGFRLLHDKTDHSGDWLSNADTDRSFMVQRKTTELILESSTEVSPNNALEAMNLTGVGERRMCQLLWETNRDLFNALVLRMIEEENNE